MEQFKFKDLKSTATGDSITVQWNIETELSTDEFRQGVYLFLGDDNVGDPIELPQNVRSYTFQNLEADSEYAVYFQAYKEPGHLPIAEEFIEIRTEANDTCPPEVSSTALSVSDTTPDGFKITWKRAKDAVTKAKDIVYTVYLKEAEASDSDWENVQSKKYTNTYTAKGLKTGARYAFYVVAADEAGNTLTYDTGEVSLQDKEAPTIKNADLRLIDTTSDSITVAWDKATDNVTDESEIRYIVMHRNIGVANSTWRGIILRGVYSHTFTKLDQGAEYAIRVEARDNAGNVNQYALLQAETKDTEAPKTDKSLTATSDANSVTLKWNPATDNVTEAGDIRYQVTMREIADNGTEKQIEREISETTTTFTRLDSGTLYYFKVNAVDKAGNSSTYGILRVKTKDTEAPKTDNSLTATSEEKSVTLKWNPATDNVTTAGKIRYEISRLVSGQWRKVGEVTGKSSYEVTGLVSSTQFSFKVDAIDEADNRLSYNTVTVMTKDGVPPVTSNSLTATADANSVTLKWAQAKDDVTDSNKIRYEIYRRTSGDWSYVKTVTGTSSTVTGLSTNTQYFFRVDALDEAGNARSYNTVTVTTKVPVTGVSLSDSSITLICGLSQQLTATVSPSNASNKSIIWSSSNSSIATVSSNGLVKAVSSGTTTIKAVTSDGGKVASVSVKVITLAFHLCYNNSSGGYSSNMLLGDTVSPYADNKRLLTAGRVVIYVFAHCGTEQIPFIDPKWKRYPDTDYSFVQCQVSDPSLTYDITGGLGAPPCPAILFYWKKNGSYTVSIKVKDPKGSGTLLLSKTFTFVVKNPEWETVAVTGVSLKNTNIPLFRGQTYQLSASIMPSNATNKNVTWGSSNTSVATVTASGVVGAQNRGVARISATTTDGRKSASATVTVSSIVYGISLGRKENGSYVGDLPAVIRPYGDNGRWDTSRRQTVVYVLSHNGTETQGSGIDNSYVGVEIQNPNVLSLKLKDYGWYKTANSPAIVINWLRRGTSAVTLKIKDPRGSGRIISSVTFTIVVDK